MHVNVIGHNTGISIGNSCLLVLWLLKLLFLYLLLLWYLWLVFLIAFCYLCIAVLLLIWYFFLFQFFEVVADCVLSQSNCRTNAVYTSRLDPAQARSCASTTRQTVVGYVVHARKIGVARRMIGREDRCRNLLMLSKSDETERESSAVMA